ncbi:hypothetical protein GL218_01404 [Daldinia childiae]|uniref:uncharacterized protein n=1 Tax=Daldinia childiae TaxID=326645 RepID=UPI00144687D2|nr:uncharacterized protein GL218_01404 [Daldinia childiae]KAF3063681.1 hypothetical protein GL218_01404 [Daldinia childiae]
MAPSTIVFDYRGQIVDNCEFFLAKHDVVSVVTVKDVLGDYKAYAIRSNQSSRDALLSSEPRATPLLAVESLHTKSCEAVQQFISTNGFSFPPDFKKTRFDDDDDEDEDEDEEDGNDDDDIASIFSNILSDRPVLSTAAPSYKTSSTGEVKMTPATSTTTTVPITHGREVRDERSNNISKPRTNPPPPGRQSPEAFIFPNIRPPYTLSQAEELVMELMNGPLSNNYPRFPGPPPPPPPPPPGYNTAPKPQPAVPSWPPAARGPSIPPPANFTPQGLPQGLRGLHRGHQPPTTAAAASFAPRLYDIALTIRWLGHGEARVLASCKASVQALKNTAVTYVTRHAGAFDREGAPPNRNNPKWMGCVRLRRASIRNLHDEEYDLNMELYQDDDLTRFCSGRGIPRFEVEVEDQVDGTV